MHFFIPLLLFISVVSSQSEEDEKIDYNDDEKIDYNDDGKIDYSDDEVKCLACQKCIKDIEAEIQNVTPAKKLPKTFIIDGEGNIGEPNIEYRRSETFLIDIMENICDRMDNAVKVKHKTTGEMMLFTLALADGKMNPLINDIDIPEDSGLGNNPKMYCEDMMDKYGDEILELFKVEENLVEKICTTITNFCPTNEKVKEEL